MATTAASAHSSSTRLAALAALAAQQPRAARAVCSWSTDALPQKLCNEHECAYNKQRAGAREELLCGIEAEARDTAKILRVTSIGYIATRRARWAATGEQHGLALHLERVLCVPHV